jgi:hypothetical protein
LVIKKRGTDCREHHTELCRVKFDRSD